MLFCKILTKGEHEGVLLMTLGSYKITKFYCGQKTFFFQIYISLSLILLVILNVQISYFK